jgi:hypothetical protein
MLHGTAVKKKGELNVINQDFVSGKHFTTKITH